MKHSTLFGDHYFYGLPSVEHLTRGQHSFTLIFNAFYVDERKDKTVSGCIFMGHLKWVFCMFFGITFKGVFIQMTAFIYMSFPCIISRREKKQQCYSFITLLLEITIYFFYFTGGWCWVIKVDRWCSVVFPKGGDGGGGDEYNVSDYEYKYESIA